MVSAYEAVPEQYTARRKLGHERPDIEIKVDTQNRNDVTCRLVMVRCFERKDRLNARNLRQDCLKIDWNSLESSSDGGSEDGQTHGRRINRPYSEMNSVYIPAAAGPSLEPDEIELDDIAPSSPLDSFSSQRQRSYGKAQKVLGISEAEVQAEKQRQYASKLCEALPDEQELDDKNDNDRGNHMETQNIRHRSRKKRQSKWRSAREHDPSDHAEEVLDECLKALSAYGFG